MLYTTINELGGAKEGVKINWFNGNNYGEILHFTEAELEKNDASS